MKTCKRCGETRPLADFCLRPSNRDGRDTNCVSCKSATNKAWREANRDRARIHYRKANLFRDYGITPAQFDAMNESQGGVCAVCGRPERAKNRTLSVDHCHQTGKVRALLCTQCNVSLGNMDDNPALLREAATYLELHASAHLESTH